MFKRLLILGAFATLLISASHANAQSGTRGGNFGSGSRSYAPSPASGNRAYGPPGYGSSPYGFGSAAYGPVYGGGCSSAGRAVMYQPQVVSGCGVSSFGNSMYHGSSSCSGSSCGVTGGQYESPEESPMQQHAPIQQSPAGSGTSSSTYRPNSNAIRYSGASRQPTDTRRMPSLPKSSPAPIQHNAPPLPDSAALTPSLNTPSARLSRTNDRAGQRTFALDSDIERRQLIR
jgi:hypothetical protein